MTPPTHVVLLRGINVGGKNVVPMAHLRDALKSGGFASVRTYIQSGNVLLAAPGTPDTVVTDAVERLLADAFGVHTMVMTLTADTLRHTVSAAPAGFGTEPAVYHYDVAFLRPRIRSADVLAAWRLRDGVDTGWPGESVVYFRRLSAQRTKSRMSSILRSPHYQNMTLRNWRTASALVKMLDAP